VKIPNPAVKVAPKMVDALQPITLNQTELAGEIGRRISDLAYKNYMALDLDGHFVEPFRARPFTAPSHYVGVGKVIDAGSLFAAYTGDPEVSRRTTRLIEAIIGTRDADGYIGIFKPEPEAHQNHHKLTQVHRSDRNRDLFPRSRPGNRRGRRTGGGCMNNLPGRIPGSMVKG
jgi:DUF1680 family protein